MIMSQSVGPPALSCQHGHVWEKCVVEIMGRRREDLFEKFSWDASGAVKIVCTSRMRSRWRPRVPSRCIHRFTVQIPGPAVVGDRRRRPWMLLATTRAGAAGRRLERRRGRCSSLWQLLLQLQPAAHVGTHAARNSPAGGRGRRSMRRSHASHSDRRRHHAADDVVPPSPTLLLLLKIPLLICPSRLKILLHPFHPFRQDRLLHPLRGPSSRPRRPDSSFRV